MTQVQAVVFDIGNVLLGWQPEQFYDGLIGQARRKALFAEVDLDGMNARIDRGAPFRDTVQAMCDAHPDRAQEIWVWHDRWLDMLTPVIEENVAVLRALKARAIPVFALSNFGIDTFALARKHHDFLHEFDQTFISGQLGMMKPEPEIYAALEAQISIAPDRLFFIDDRAENIDMALRRGWKGHLFSDTVALRNELIMLGLLD